MRYGMIAVAVILLLLGSTARSSYGDTAYGVGALNGFDALSGVFSLDTASSTAKMLIHTPGVSWYGATDGPSADTFYAVANPAYTPIDPATGSELYLINTTTWTYGSVFIEAPAGGGPIREIGLDESTGTLYGTDYLNLYTLPTAPGGGAATFVGTFGNQPGTTDPIDYVFSLDYDPSVGQLVGTSWRPGPLYGDPGETDLYYFDRKDSATPGAGTLVEYTGIDRFSDVWYSNNSGTLLGASRARVPLGGSPIPGRIFDVNATTGAATQIGTTPGVSLYGLANATPGFPEPVLPYVSAPLTNFGYETYVVGDIDTLVHIAGDGSHLASPPPYEEYGENEAAIGNVDVPASVPDPQSGSEPWQNTNATAIMDLSDSISIPEGMLRVSSTMTVTATGSDEGVAGVTRHSSVYGTASIHGAIGVGYPESESAGLPVLFGAGVYTWGDGMDLLTWNLKITDSANPTIVYLDVNETSDPWFFSFDVVFGQILDYEFIYDGLLFETPDGSYELNADVDFGAPEPATVLCLCIGAIPLVLKRRRRGS